MASAAAERGQQRARSAALRLLLPFLGAALLAFLLAALAFEITHGSHFSLGTGTAAAEGGAGGTAAGGRLGGSQRQQQQRGDNAELNALQKLMQTRVCGSPAVDGYAHVKPECLEDSPTNQWWQKTKPKPDDLDIHIERHADYDGLAVGWGIGNTKKSVEECAEACRQHVPKGNSGVFSRLPCNAFAFCSEEKCFEPDAHSHSKGDCWLKFTEAPASPEVNMRGRLSLAMQLRHPAAPIQVQWHSGVILPRGVRLTNGSWSPRHDW